MEYNTLTLANGLRIIHLPVNSAVAYCGFAINGGTRDEATGEEGMAHFVEHMVFKGTQKRRSWHIINRMENVGGELNAYTAKEETVIYSVFLEEHLQRATELICDLVRHSNCPLGELNKEREVVLDEINSYRDNPSELIYDEFENQLFAGHTLGHPILGYPESIELFTPELCTQFLQKQYTPSNMVFFVMGRSPFKQVVKLAEKYMGDMPPSNHQNIRTAPEPIAQFTSSEKMETYQTHALYGGRAYNMFHPKRRALFLLNNLLGGPGMNSRLNLSLREKRGYVYNVESSVTTYSDTGVFALYLGTDPKNWGKCQDLVQKTLQQLCNKELTTLQLHTAKKQLMGQMGVGMENRENIALNMAKSFLHYNRYSSLSENYKHIEAITTSEILEVANEVIAPNNLSLLTYS